MQEREDRETLPGEEEMKRSEVALIRLVEAYHLDTSKLADGILSGPSISTSIRSEKKLSGWFIIESKEDDDITIDFINFFSIVWEFGRLTIGLLNQYLFMPSIKLLDAGLRVLKSGEQVTANPIAGFLSGPSSVIPVFVDEHMRPEDLLSIKYKAMKHVSVFSEKNRR